jgi:hypothetical protein
MYTELFSRVLECDVFLAMDHIALMNPLLRPLLGSVNGACGKELPVSSICFPVSMAMLAQG